MYICMYLYIYIYIERERDTHKSAAGRRHVKLSRRRCMHGAHSIIMIIKILIILSIMIILIIAIIIYIYIYTHIYIHVCNTMSLSLSLSLCMHGARLKRTMTTCILTRETHIQKQANTTGTKNARFTAHVSSWNCGPSVKQKRELTQIFVDLLMKDICILIYIYIYIYM